MSSRRRAAGFGVLAVLCAIASASIASGYRESVDDQLGELRAVVVVKGTLPARRTIQPKAMRRDLEVREVPARFAPPDALADPTEALGNQPLAPIPPGSYLLASHLRAPAPVDSPEPRLAGNLNPVEITVTGAGPLESAAPAPVDVVVASEPVTGGRSRVHVAAQGVRLIELEPAAPEDGTATGGDSWNATLALDRAQALRLIEAENFAREIRLIPAS